MTDLLTRLGLALCLALFVAGCPATDDDDDSAVTDDDDDDATADDDDATAGDDDDTIYTGCDPADVPCLDDLILDLSLHDDKVSEGEVQNTADGDDWVSTVDATAGGFNMATENPFIYLRFDDDGLSRVDIDDETALESMEWHIAARRYIIRLNGGTSGPSCVGAAPQFGSTYADVTEVPAGTTFDMDASYDGDCNMIDDGSGLDGSPDTALTPWWNYGSCVATTGVPFLVELNDERVIKLEIEAYYQSGQDDCNGSGTPGNTSAMYTWRWAFVG
jgi:hypothetical protein